MAKKNKINWIILVKAILFIFIFCFLLIILIQFSLLDKKQPKDSILIDDREPIIDDREPIFDRYGVIEDIKNNTIVVKYQPIKESDIEKATLIINPETEIKKITILKLATETRLMQFQEKTIYFSELKEGDEVVVFADEDISAKSEFVAKKIKLIERKY